jgi:hypothetical protein
MSTTTGPVSEQLREALHNELLRLARREEDLAANEGEQVHYCQAMPVTVAVHRQCAAALRAAADDLLTAGRSRTDTR